ncbi:MAG: transposase [Acidobacteria bacterium]|nr:transposase [Acidobacteriota bacterium]
MRRLADQGKLLCLLGEGMEALLTAALDGKNRPVDEAVAAATLLHVAQGVLGVGPHQDIRASVGGALRPRSRPTPAKGPLRGALGLPAADSFLEGRDLSAAWCPVIWVGSQEIRGAWASLALGAGIDGVRRVIALRAGSVRDANVADELVADLVARGLPSASGILVVTSGSRTLDASVERGWGHRAILSHCRHRVLDEVLSHVVESERAVVQAQLTGAWSLPSDEGRALLQDLVKRLERNAPGAAERLARSVEASLVVDLLDVDEPLKERLTSMGTCGMAFKRALQWGGSTEAGIQGLATGLMVWLGRTRRLMGWQVLGSLAAVLQRTVAASAPAPRP